MKRLVGILCCLFLLFASAAWALEKCQSLAAHHAGHDFSENVTHVHTHDFGIPRDRSLPEDQMIHCCADSREIPSFVAQPSPRITRSTVAYQILPSRHVPFLAEATGWITHSEKRPPGWFLAAVSRYLSLSVLRV